MCGILGSINFEFDSDVLDLIKHRGPDDYGIDKFSIGQNKIIFSQRRLSIIDLSSAGHQPMLSNCSNYSIIFNGEIYNHIDLRNRLPKEIKFNGHSDTETLLYYLIYKGIDGLKDLNGIFSLAFLDIKKQNLFLARDPFGIKPLYFFEDGSSLIFSSEVRPIQHLTNANKIDKFSLASLLKLRYNASPYTLFKSVKKVKPGQYILINIDDSIDKRTFNYAINSVSKMRNIKMNDALMMYEENLERAVKRQLLSDVDIGIMLSGGIDSALIAYYAKKHYGGNLKAFTIGFEGSFNEDEISDAQETANFLNIEHHIKKITFNDYLSLIEDCTRIIEEPLATTSIIPMYYLSQLASEHVKVVLTGQGADEPLGGYGRYKSEIFRNSVPSFFRSAVKIIVKLLNTKDEQLIKGSSTIRINNMVSRFLKTYEVFSDKEINNLIGINDTLSEKLIFNMIDEYKFSKLYSDAEKMMAIDSRLNLSDDLLNYTDKITMNFSIECRVPMLDIDLVNYIESLPQKFKLNFRNGKIIHKQLANRILPRSIVNRSKKGFQSPTEFWFRKEMTNIKNLLLNRNTNFSNIFNLNEVEKVLDEHLIGFNKDKQIFLLLSLYYWFKNNNL